MENHRTEARRGTQAGGGRLSCDSGARGNCHALAWGQIRIFTLSARFGENLVDGTLASIWLRLETDW